jgi:4-amino-4-deoxy-L-arabinose transferase-like glycosyltransferase
MKSEERAQRFWERLFSPWLALLIPLFAILQRETVAFRLRVFLPALVVASGFALWRVRSKLRSPREAGVAGAFIAVTVVVNSLPYIVNPNNWDLYQFLIANVPVVAAWVFFLVVVLTHPGRWNEGHPNESSGHNQAVMALPGSVLLLSTFILLAVAHWLTEVDYVKMYDEPLYLLQSRLMREPGFVRQIDESLSRFFVLRQSIFDGGRFYTQYPPGQPALLAVFDTVGLRWWTGVALSTAGVLFTYLLGRDVFSEFAGRAAAGLLAANELFVTHGTSYMPHGSSLAMATAAAWLLLRSEHVAGWRRSMVCLAAGALLGCTMAIRPLTGAALSVSILLWLALRRKHGWRDLASIAGLVAVGGTMPVLALLHYNQVTNGSPLLFGYAAANGPLHDLGFGLRGFILPDSLGRMTTMANPFTIGRAVSNQIGVIVDIAHKALPPFLVMPLIWVAWRYKQRVRWSIVLAFLFLPALHFFYFYPHMRFNLELFPFLFIAAAGMLCSLRRQDWRLANGLLLSVVAIELLITGLDVRYRVAERPVTIRHAARAAVRDAQASNQKLLIFAMDQGLLHWASWFNVDEFPGDVIIARHLGEDDHRLIRLFPDHEPMRMFREAGRVRLEPIK